VIPQDVHEAALSWQVTLWSGEVTDGERQAFARWRAAAPEHEAAWARIQQFGARLQTVPDDVARAVLRPASGSRRRVLRGAGALAVAGVVGGLVVRQASRADLQTARGERRPVTLPDGTAIVLAPDTALEIVYDTHRRTLRLRRGEVLVQSAHDPDGRPLAVETAHGRAEALGTRFTVRIADERSRVQVFDGAVATSAAATPDTRVVVAAGQQATFDRDRVAAPTRVDPLAAAWSQGLVVAERQRLGDLLAELAPHLPGVLRCDPAVADLVVSSVYRLDTPDATLDALAAGLPVRVQRYTRWWVVVGPR